VKYKVFTDRNIYRPGQTVYYKIIAYRGKSPDFKVVDNFSLDLKLQDENSTDLAEAAGITNDFGSFSGSLILPKSGFLFGSIYLTINGLSAKSVFNLKKIAFNGRVVFFIKILLLSLILILSKLFL
jgi:hypothetical protein